VTLLGRLSLYASLIRSATVASVSPGGKVAVRQADGKAEREVSQNG